MTFFNLLSGFVLIVMGINIVITQRIPQGKYTDIWIDIGIWAYLLGGLFITIGLYILYIQYKNKKTKK